MQIISGEKPPIALVMVKIYPISQGAARNEVLSGESDYESDYRASRTVYTTTSGRLRRGTCLPEGWSLGRSLWRIPELLLRPRILLRSSSLVPSIRSRPLFLPWISVSDVVTV